MRAAGGTREGHKGGTLRGRQPTLHWGWPTVWHCALGAMAGRAKFGNGLWGSAGQPLTGRVKQGKGEWSSGCARQAPFPE